MIFLYYTSNNLLLYILSIINDNFVNQILISLSHKKLITVLNTYEMVNTTYNLEQVE